MTQETEAEKNNELSKEIKDEMSPGNSWQNTWQNRLAVATEVMQALEKTGEDRQTWSDILSLAAKIADVPLC